MMIKALIKWTILSSIVGILTGIVSVYFYHSIEWAIEWRKAHNWIIYFLPLVGGATAWFYSHYGREIEGGNNLILDEIHEPKKHIPFRMVPMICLLYTSPSPRDRTRSRMPSSA